MKRAKRQKCTHDRVYAIRPFADDRTGEERLVCACCGATRLAWTHYPHEFYEQTERVAYPPGAAFEILGGPLPIDEAQTVAQQATRDRICSMPGPEGAALRLRRGLATPEEAAVWEKCAAEAYGSR